MQYSEKADHSSISEAIIYPSLIYTDLDCLGRIFSFLVKHRLYPSIMNPNNPTGFQML